MIRAATLTDLDSLIQLENHSFESDQLSRRNFRYLLTKANATTLVDADNQHIRGCAIILYNSATSIARLYSIVVGAEYRGQGIGQHLLKAAEEDAVRNKRLSLRLEVRRDNHQAIQMYIKNGYKEIGILNDYYEDHMEAIRFEKRLASKK